jgi:DNA repair exonuclease SbcCD ATPase subunit
MSAMTKQNLLNEIALGRLSWRQLAGKYGRHYDTIRKMASDNAEEIEKLKEQYKGELSILWVTDRFNRQLERQMGVERINQQQEHLLGESQEFADTVGVKGSPANEYWHKLESLKSKLLKDIAEEEGQLPTRAAPIPPDMGKATYEIPGIDLGEVVKDFERARGGA